MTQLINFKNIHVMAGSVDFNNIPDIPFNEHSISFLSELSKNIRNSSIAKNYPDVMALSFWCRQGNLQVMKTKQTNLTRRIGRGLVFHVTPSNVPLNFVYSYIFGLLSGNSNVIKIPSTSFPQSEFLCKKIDSLLKRKKYESLYKKTLLLKYSRNNNVTEYLSSICDARVLWGGDATIKNIRQFETSSRCVDIAFADRYSISIINEDLLSTLSKNKFTRLIKLFYNDIFAMDQNACSSPHLIIWKSKENTNEKELFWDSLQKYARKNYSLKSASVLDKYTNLCKAAIEINPSPQFKNYDNLIYRLSLSELPNNIDSFRSNSGYIYEYNVQDLDEIAHIINNKYQTMTYYGLDRSYLLRFIRKNNLLGIDRIVPIGKALDINLEWDGIEVVNSLSRIINFS